MLSIIFSLNTEGVKSCNLRTWEAEGGGGGWTRCRSSSQPLAQPFWLRRQEVWLHVSSLSLAPLTPVSLSSPGWRWKGWEWGKVELLFGKEKQTRQAARAKPALSRGHSARDTACSRSLPVQCSIWRTIFNFLGTTRLKGNRQAPHCSLSGLVAPPLELHVPAGLLG